ncbi:hypothetical protein FA15DRAFT_588025 [Coprinopsis marcescibilis]|uniref:Uncharacterized protein n=1 Tax=Coprinopsis marcescibilis TaxID=230819 RepID=A0A5C3L203_COPMA|nr:hypothetical protein FA15DRAFT_588025 [Coprinopsis marcescibilis]
MYFIGRDVKSKEGQSSVYESEGHGLGGTDKSMTSADVSAAVSVPKLKKERLRGAADTGEH